VTGNTKMPVQHHHTADISGNIFSTQLAGRFNAMHELAAR